MLVDATVPGTETATGTSYSTATAGIGRLFLIDPDRVDRSNLHRQLLHRTADLGRLKVESAAERLRAKHPELVVGTDADRFDGANAAALSELEGRSASRRLETRPHRRCRGRL